MKLKVGTGKLTNSDVADDNQRLEEIDDSFTDRVTGIKVSVACVSVRRTHNEHFETTKHTSMKSGTVERI
jgi:hypothetical protein